MSRRNEEWRRNRHGDQWRRNREEDESGWGNERFRRPGPRGLKGKDIGLYYRNLNKYGKKKPDLTVGNQMINVSACFCRISFSIVQVHAVISFKPNFDKLKFENLVN